MVAGLRLFVALAALLFVAGPTWAIPSQDDWMANGGFEHRVRHGPEALEGTPLGRPIYLGHQLEGCGHTGDLWRGFDCNGDRAEEVPELLAFASNPQGEVDYWFQDHRETSDFAVLHASDANEFHAINWSPWSRVYTPIEDVDGDGDRELFFANGHTWVWEVQNPVLSYSLLPFGRFESLTFTVEGGAVDGGGMTFFLESFPLRRTNSNPVAPDYALVVPAWTWTIEGDQVTVDPLKGHINGPRFDLNLPGVPGQPSPRQLISGEWNNASPEERRAMLDTFRSTQFSFWNMAQGLVVDDVRMGLVE